MNNWNRIVAAMIHKVAITIIGATDGKQHPHGIPMSIVPHANGVVVTLDTGCQVFCTSVKMPVEDIPLDLAVWHEGHRYMIDGEHAGGNVVPLIPVETGSPTGQDVHWGDVLQVAGRP